MTQPAIAPAAVAFASPPLVPATLGRRVGAYLIDGAIASVLVLVVIFIGVAIVRPSPSSSVSATLAGLAVIYGLIALVGLGWFVVYTLMQGGRGSIGQRLVKIQLRDAATAAPIGFWRALLRNVIWGLAANIIVGYFTVFFDSSGRRQGWHDKVANAMVVDATDAAPTTAPSGYAAAVPPPPPAPPTAAFPATPPSPAFPPATSVFPVSVPVEPPTSPQPFVGASSFPAPPSAPAAPSTPVPERAGGMISSVPGITIDPEALASAAAPAPAAPAPAAPTAPVAPEAPRLSPPQVSAPPAPSTAFAAPVAPAAPVVGAAASGPSTGDLDLDETRAAAPSPVIVVLVWDDGTRTAVYTRTLFGRNPSREDGAVVASIRDETLSLSKTHFEVGPGADGAYVVDRHSTNGTTLVRGGGRQQLVAGSRTTLAPGDVLEFGDRRATVGGGS